MDSQISISIEKRDYYNENTLFTYNPITIIPKIITNKKVFSFKESDNIFIKFDYPDDYRILFESYNSEYFEIKNHDWVNISSGREEFGCYFCGTFSFNVDDDSQLYEYFFSVEPKNLEYSSVLKIRDYLNNYYTGLSLDILKKNNRVQLYSPKAGNPAIYDKYSFLISNFSELNKYINIYLTYEPTIAEKKEFITNTTKGMNYKSYKWLCSKGQSKNSNISSPEKNLVKHTIRSYNNSSNAYFKQELIFWNRELYNIISHFQNFILQLTIESNYLEDCLKEINSKIIEFNDQYNISKQVINTYFNKQSRIQNEIRDKKYLINNYNKDIKKLRVLKSTIEYALQNTWVKNVKLDHISKSNHIDKRLSSLSEFRLRYSGMRFANNKKLTSIHLATFAEKCTPKLFETYIYIVLIKLLEDIGFTITDSINYHYDNLLYILSNTSKIVLKKEGITCKISYDYELLKSSQLNHNDFCYINSYHNKPDFIVSFYENSSEIPYSSFIIEAKWRSLKSIYNSVEDTDVVVTLKDYYNLAFKDCTHNKTHRGLIEKVIVLYPDLGETLLKIEDDYLLAYGVNIKEDLSLIKALNEIRMIMQNIVRK